jgi:hypothetical protein
MKWKILMLILALVIAIQAAASKEAFSMGL